MKGGDQIIYNMDLNIPFLYNELNINIKWMYQYEDSIQPKDYIIEDLDYEFKKNLFENYQFWRLYSYFVIKVYECIFPEYNHYTCNILS